MFYGLVRRLKSRSIHHHIIAMWERIMYKILLGNLFYLGKKEEQAV